MKMHFPRCIWSDPFGITCFKLLQHRKHARMTRMLGYKHDAPQNVWSLLQKRHQSERTIAHLKENYLHAIAGQYTERVRVCIQREIRCEGDGAVKRPPSFSSTATASTYTQLFFDNVLIHHNLLVRDRRQIHKDWKKLLTGTGGVEARRMARSLVLLVALLCSSCHTLEDSDGIFTSNVDLQRLLKTEAEIVRELHSYIKEEEIRIDKLKK